MIAGGAIAHRGLLGASFHTLLQRPTRVEKLLGVAVVLSLAFWAMGRTHARRAERNR